MYYYVLLDDGQRFGPADLSLLNLWAAEGRIHAGTILEAASNKQRLFASQLPGLSLGGTPQGGWSQPPAPIASGRYHRPVAAGSDGNSELTASWICSALSWVLIPVVLSGIGWYLAQQAMAKGNPTGSAAKTFAIVSVVLQAAGYCCLCGLGGFLGS